MGMNKLNKNSKEFSLALNQGLVIVFSFIVFLWFLLHIFSIDWGLPGLYSLAPDSIPPSTSYNAQNALLAGGNKYPPLQYLINSIFLKQHDEKGQNIESIICLRTERMKIMNWITAVMQLVSAIVIALIASITLRSFAGSLIAGSLYLLNPMCLYYSNTSNMDVPYSMWILLSLFLLIVAQKNFHNKRRFIIYNVFFAIFMGFAFCTKDQAYASYVLPLSVFVIWHYFKLKKLSFILIECAIWILVFLLCVVCVYAAVGGADTFFSHMHWIMNDGIKEYKQVTLSFFGQLELILISLKNICQMLDYPIIGLLTVSVIFLCAQYKKRNNDLKFSGTAKIVLLICLITYISILSFFIEIIQYSYVRFYLPLLPFFCWLIAWSFINFKNNFIFKSLFLLFLVCQLLLSSQFIMELKYNSSVSLKNYYSTLAGTRIAASDGAAIGIVISYDKSGDKQYIVLRDWSNSTFGYLPGCKSINVNPFSIAMLSPDLVISTNNNDEVLISNGYKMIKDIEGFPILLSSLYHFKTPVFYIYEKQFNGNILTPQLKMFMTGTKFEIIMLNIASILNPNMIEYQVRLMGKIAPEFRCLDLDKYYITPYAFRFLINAYESEGRLEDLAKTYRFILETNYGDLFRVDAEKFFKTHPEVLLRN